MAIFDTVVDKLTSIFSKEFFIASVPVLSFVAMHAGMAAYVSPKVLKWFRANYFGDTTRSLAVTFFTLMFVVIVTYVTSTLSTPMREILEGKRWPEVLASIFRQKYRARLAKVERLSKRATREARALRKGETDWTDKLAAAAVEGQKLATCKYRGCTALSRLRVSLAWDRPLNCHEVEAAVTELSGHLKLGSTLAKDSVGRLLKDAEILEGDRVTLLQIIDATIASWDAARVRLSNEIQFQYAGKNVAPTRMGNMAGVAEFYAYSRYAMNLSIFWTRLQKSIQADRDFYGSLQDAKRQLDFLIALFWQTAVFAGFWSIALALLQVHPKLFLGVSVGGLSLMRIWYGVALANYWAFSDLMRASVDLYRLNLLKDLKVAAPVNAEQERLLWETLERRLGNGDRDNIALLST